MRPSELKQLLAFSIQNRASILIKGSPGIGKSDLVAQACEETDTDLIISHPVVSDPTDYKGLPGIVDGNAEFLPYGDLRKLMEADKPTVCFLDDLGQSAPAVQASCMQMLLARQINGKPISKHVTFTAATNRKEDKAGVTGILEPVKSRFAAIVELDISITDWIMWALHKGNMPTELIAFIRWKPEMLNDTNPTKDIVNRPCPRTVANVGKWLNRGLPEKLWSETFKGAAGEGFAAEFVAFLKFFQMMPSIDKILAAPDKVEVPTDPGVLYAISGALAARIDDITAPNAFKFIKRMPEEVGVACVKDAILRKEEVLNTRAFIDWATANGNFVMAD